MGATPASIGILMDGNRRYAKERGMTSYEGHRLGVEKIKELVRWAREAGLKEVILYGFSTENWNRAPEEVAYLMKLFETTFGGDDLRAIEEEGFRVRFIGERHRLPASLKKRMEEAEMRTEGNMAGTILIALSYGGRAEILAAVNKLLAEGAGEVDEKSFRDAMWSAGTLDPDIIIRTGGDQRLSNFLPWQSVYSELFFTKTYWPGFTKEEFDSIIETFGKRERRHGR
ncbi:MAG: di-trans,poly-cis-decaprenylcistransferase [Candidatus Pacebacteria bacterium]|nr:di-trans,poly-cis-decaprenylcistransferase [Candidatus Paceibacterota bacterium]MBP9840061.1 di-trans,poly-cis-decaprenylcistransferase [Candidatus Paceibacterota bacterium]